MYRVGIFLLQTRERLCYQGRSLHEVRLKKAILVFALLVLGSSAFAETKTLLFCKNIDQGDIKTLEIEQDENSDETGSITLVEHRKDGTSKTKKVRLKDFKDAYVPLINEIGRAHV